MSTKTEFVMTEKGQAQVETWVTPVTNSYATEVHVRAHVTLSNPPRAEAGHGKVFFGPYSETNNREHAMAKAKAQALAMLATNPKPF
jgi:hypothetical protein